MKCSETVAGRAHRDPARDAVTLGERRGRDRLQRRRLDAPEEPVVELLRRHQERHLAAADELLGGLRGHARVRDLGARGLLQVAVGRSALEVPFGRVLEPQRALVGLEQARDRRDGGVHDRLQRSGGRELVGELEPCLRVLGLPVQALVQPRVLERRGRVAGQHLEQPHVVLVEPADTELRQEDDAVDTRPVAERHGDDGLVDRLRTGHELAELAVLGVREQEGAPRLGDAAGDAEADRHAEPGESPRLPTPPRPSRRSERARRPRRGRRGSCGSPRASSARSRSPRRSRAPS